MLIFAVLLAVSQPTFGYTLYQTGINRYDPRIDLRTDAVLLHRHGDASDWIPSVIEQWTVTEQDLYIMWFIGSDAGKHYVEGRVDGVERHDEIEARPSGDHITIDNIRPYMVPTRTWNEYMKTFARQAVEAHAVGIAPEEPLAHTYAGFSPAFKREWAEFYGEDWVNPYSSLDAFWQASKLKSHLYLRAVEDVADEAKFTAAQSGQDVRVVLPVHSLISYAAGQMIYPTGATTALESVDAFIGQVWTGPVGWSLPRYAGTQLHRENGFIETAWVLYSSFANLTAQSDQKMYLLADPVEDDPNYGWDQYRRWYNHALVSKLMFPTVDGYEVMPWPERIFMRGFSTGGGSPGPSDYLTQLMVNTAVLHDILQHQEIVWHGGSEGLAVLVGDTLGWQRGGPRSSTMDSFYGLVMPLLRHGLPVQVLPLERTSDPEYLDPYDLLLLSYDMWKPLSGTHHQALADWVKNGGVLLFFEGNDPYRTIQEWWTTAGYQAPVEHLLETLGLPYRLDFEHDTTMSAEGIDPMLRPALQDLLHSRLRARDRQVTYLDRPGAESSFAFVETVGEGALIYIGIPAASLALSDDTSQTLRNLAELALETLLQREYREHSVLHMQRGDYHMVQGLPGASTTLEGLYLDLLDPTLPLLTSVHVKEGDSRLLIDASWYTASPEPVVLYASHELLQTHHEDHQTVLVSAGPWLTRGVIRLSGQAPSSISAHVIGDTEHWLYDHNYLTSFTPGDMPMTVPHLWPRANPADMDYAAIQRKAAADRLREADVKWTWDESSSTLLIDFEQWHSGVLLTIHW